TTNLHRTWPIWTVAFIVLTATRTRSRPQVAFAREYRNLHQDRPDRRTRCRTLSHRGTVRQVRPPPRTLVRRASRRCREPLARPGKDGTMPSGTFGRRP